MTHIVRIFADSDGKSHFEDLEAFPEEAVGFKESQLWECRSVLLREAPADFTSEFHTAWERQFVVILRGDLEIETGDGKRREVGPGTILLMEDTEGGGHAGRSIGSDPHLWLFVHLKD